MSLWLLRIKGYLFPHAAEHDPEFLREVRRLSVVSLYVIAGVTLCMPLISILFHRLTSIFEPLPMVSLNWMLLSFIALSAALVVAARTRFGRRHARKFALVSGFITAALLTWGTFSADASFPDRVPSSILNIVVVLLVAVAAIPAWPIQILLLGGAMSTFHWFSAKLAVEMGWIEPVSLHSYAGLDAVTMLCTALAAVSYQRLLWAYRARQQDVATQSRLLVTENAATLGRFAGTLSHELNNPIGVISSVVDSLQKIEEKSIDSGAQPERLGGMRRELIETAQASADQLSQVVDRMQRLTNLDRAETLAVDLDELLRDVTAMLKPEARKKVRIETSDELPSLTLKPQQMSAVLSRLLERASDVSGAEGAVELSARQTNGSVEIRVADEGRPLSAKERQALFEPAFAVRDGRVIGANWSLFSARRIVQEHGGDIEVRSRGKSGAEVTVRLPSAPVR